MKRRVGNSLFDTNTARLIGTTADGVKLYRNRNGRYFTERDSVFFAIDDDTALQFIRAHGMTEPETNSRVVAAYVSPVLAAWTKEEAKRQRMTQSQFIARLIENAYKGKYWNE